MTTKDFTLPSDIKSEIKSVGCITQHNADAISTLAPRERIAMEATWEIEALSRELVERGKTINGESADVFKEGYIIKNLAMRIKELNSIIMSALDDDLVSVESLKIKLG